MKRYYMTAESTDEELYEHQGNIRGARTIAQRIANERNETIFINDVSTEDIVDCISPDFAAEKNGEGVKEYNIYIAGGTQISTVSATCISKACKKFIQTLSKKAMYEPESEEYASVRYIENYSICSDFVVMEA